MKIFFLSILLGLGAGLLFWTGQRLYAAWLFIDIITGESRLRNRKSPLLCPECKKGLLCRHSYGSTMLWSCHECNHLQFDAPRGANG